MKILKYTLLFLSVFLLSFILAFGYSKFVNRKVGVTPLPVSATPTPNTIAFSLENAPASSLKGEIATMSGDIYRQDRVATESSKLISPVVIQQGEKLATGEKSKLSLIFQEALKIEFSQSTEIEVIQTLPANMVFSQKTGSGDYVKSGNYPVSIRTKNLLVENDGEVFISINPDKPIITVTVKSGNATVGYNDLDYMSHLFKIGAEKTFTFNYDTRKGVLK